MQSSGQPDVIVVGSGNAAFSAALSAREQGATVLMLEKAPRDWIGGNSWFTAGAFRLTHDGLDDISDLIELADGRIELPPYTVQDYHADMRRVTEDRCDPQLTGLLISEARAAADWMRTKGIRWRLMNERQAHESGGHLRFWGGLAVGTVGGGEALIDAYLAASNAEGIELRTDSPVTALLVDGAAIVGVQVTRGGEPPEEIRAPAVVLASGGFEADATLRAKYLGDDWRRAYVRGTPYNTGEALLAAVSAGAQAYGDWTGCHSIAWDAAAPMFGDRLVSNRYSRQGYPYGLVVNANGERFVDEGADFRNYTYAKYGAEILRQPEGIAFQVFDAKALGLISAIDYSTAEGSRTEASSISELAERAGIDQEAFERTVREYNAAVSNAPFDPTILDGKGTIGIEPPKSNWAQPLDTPPYVSYRVVCGITFTFGGLHINPDGGVLNGAGKPMPGLFAAGETVGGLFFHNYPGGSGLASGTVFGLRAGRSAAAHAKRSTSLAADIA
jgi:tricarballylate dehydrogenase